MRSKPTAPAFERLARMPWPNASLASSGMRPLSSALAFSWSRKAVRAEHDGELGPGVGRAHVDDPHCGEPRPGRLDAEQARGLAALDAAPEFFLGSEQQVLVERIGVDG